MRRNTLVALLTGAVLVVGSTFLPAPAEAQGRRGHVIVTRGFYGYNPFFYGPFWGGYPYYGYGAYPLGVQGYSGVRVVGAPKQAEVYVDGFYAGVVDNFDGIFQRVETTPGGHAITLHLEGYRTTTQNVYVTPGDTFKLQLNMEKLEAGETSTPPPLPARMLSQVAVPLPAPPA